MKATVANATAFLLHVLIASLHVHGAEVADLLSEQAKAAEKRVVPPLEKGYRRVYGRGPLPIVPAARVEPIYGQGGQLPTRVPAVPAAEVEAAAGVISELFGKEYQAWKNNKVPNFRRDHKARTLPAPREQLSNFEGGTMRLSRAEE